MRREQQKEERNNGVIAEKCFTDGPQPAADPGIVSGVSVLPPQPQHGHGVKEEPRTYRHQGLHD